MLRSIRWRIAVPYVFLILLVMAGLAVYLSGFVRQAYLASLEGQLAAEARLIADTLAPALAGEGATLGLDAQARHYADLLDARVTLIAPDGTVVGESHEDRTQMDNHLYRPEVQAALAHGQGSSIRHSNTVKYDMLYVAVLAKQENQVVGLVRVALPLDDVQASVAHLRDAVLTATLLAAALAVLLALFIAERTARPVRRLTDTVEQMSAGDLSARMIPTTRDEVGTLARAFNHMADRLQETIATLREEHSRLAGILEHMADGVLITDGDGRVRLVNPAALRLLGVNKEAALGRSFAQAARDHRLIELWRECRDQGRERVETVEMSRQGPSLQAIVTPLEEAEPGACLLVLQDLTQVRRSETVRRDFVSNVSHELRTPLASLKALVETLRDGALQDPPAARRFLERMETEVDALTQMVQELLELSRIESGQAPLELRPQTVADIIIPPVERLRPQAERAGLALTVELSPDLPPVRADLDRAQQVVTNLVHNAIKFTPAGGSITVTAKADQDTSRQGTEGPASLSTCLLVSVEDTGVGISSEDLPRIFERFYKADRARSGGGTGLGLAIAKHIVQAHGGRIWAKSVEGRGSTFYFTLPLES
jgi:two-component system phosphate regulon sensor histidine kinase PhoR